MIELKNVTLHAGAFCLEDVSFRVETGEYAVLMGKTGCGKSTILEAICGLRRIQSGTIHIQETEITDWAPADRGIGYVPQDLALFPTMNVFDHIAFALKLRRQPPDLIQHRVEQLACVLGVEPLLKRSVTHLSGGESQRVALGRALSFEPRVLLLDEPLSALDDSTREEIQELLLKIKHESKVTTLHVTHNQSEATALADRRLAIGNGKVL